MKWPDWLVENEPGKPTEKAPQTPQNPVGTKPVRSAGYSPMPVPLPPPAPGSGIYQRLKEKTMFEDTAVGQILNKYLTPLLALPIDERAKYKAAMAQAQAQENINSGSVLTAFDVLKTMLAEQQKSFDASIADAKKTGVDDKMAQQEDLKKQITALTVQVTRLDGDISIALGKITRAQNEFQSAFSARTAELEEQKARYTDLLK